MVSIRVLSDVHLEHRKTFVIPDAPVDIICLCGDIGDPAHPNYKEFLMQCSAICQMNTFVIMGNHEAYGRTVQQAIDIIKNICNDVNQELGAKKLVFLDNASYDLPDGIRVLGTTLWSDIDPTYAWTIRTQLSDFTRIKGWSIGDAKEAFDASLSWLRGQLEEAWLEDKRVIVMTHHAPLLSLGHPKHMSSPLQSAFVSDLEDLIQKNSKTIRYWFYGHNHYSQRIQVNDTIILSNQVGYGSTCDDDDVCTYDPSLILHVHQ